VKIGKNERDPPLFTGKLLINSFLPIFTFAIPELLDLIWRKIGCLPNVVW
jgi:hypothetical protein